MASDPGPAKASDPSSAQRSVLAVVLAWLVPGLGHLFLGHAARGVLFAVLIWGAFGLGLANDGRFALRDQKQPLLTTLQVVANLGVGPADIVARWTVYGEPAYAMPSSRQGPAAQERVDKFRDRARSGRSIYGTAYLWTAGLMNLLLLFDVWDTGRGKKSAS